MARVREMPVGKNYMHADAVSPRCFGIEYPEYIIGIMYSKKPIDGCLAIHVSVSKSFFGEVMPVTPDDLRDVENAILNAGLDWPSEVELLPFANGPFAGNGIHVWQRQSKPIAELLLEKS